MACRSAQKIRHCELLDPYLNVPGGYTTVTTVEHTFDHLSNFDSLWLRHSRQPSVDAAIQSVAD